MGPMETKQHDLLLGTRIKRKRSTTDSELHTGQVDDVFIGERTRIKQYRIQYEDGKHGYLQEAAVIAAQVGAGRLQEAVAIPHADHTEEPLASKAQVSNAAMSAAGRVSLGEHSQTF